ncbi:MAG: TonB-dependent receptor plug domain-containing protein [Bacteroidales bacterium]
MRVTILTFAGIIVSIVNSYAQHNIKEKILTDTTGNEIINYQIKGIVVKAMPELYKKSADAPLSKITIGVAQIEKSAGGNKDISKIITTIPGVATPPPNGYRNDFLVRGGGPGENKFYIDGIEIPSINHFSTQGAGGGPVGILNADFIRKVDFYTGSFPVNKSNALSSVMDITLKDGNPLKRSYKFALGASEVSASADGYIGPNLFYAASIRHSYLQFLFKVLKLPFLPTFTDAQVKLKYRLNGNNEFSFIFLGGLDRMKLNKDDVKDEMGAYTVGYLPVIKQSVYTAGITYKHYYSGEKSQNNTFAVYLSHSYLNNGSTKYLNNDESNPNNLNLKYKSVEQQTQLRVENILKYSNITFLAGAGASLPSYKNDTYQKRYINSPDNVNYSTKMEMISWNVFANFMWWSKNKKISLSGGIRIDGCNYNSGMTNPLNQFSPRLAFSYEFAKGWKFNLGAGRYFQLPPYTVMGYKDKINKLNLKYTGVNEISVGVEYVPKENIQIKLEPFYKYYFNSLYSPIDSIPLTQGGTDYGAFGNEAAISGINSVAYGIELSARWYIGEKFNFMGSYTFYRSKYKRDSHLHEIKDGKEYGNLPWDNGHLLSFSARYEFGKDYAIGVKYRLSGGSPYTPYDLEKSSYVQAWDVTGRPYYNYSLYNTERLKVFQQLDIRFDKSFYFKKWALELYIDLQNILNTKYLYPNIYVSTGAIENPSAPIAEQRYVLKSLKNDTGTILPTLGVIISF